MARQVLNLKYAIAVKPATIDKKYNLRSGYIYQPIYKAQANMLLPVISTSDRDSLAAYHWGLRLTSSGNKYTDLAIENIFQHWKVPKKLRLPLLKLVRENRCIAFANCFIIWPDKEKKPPYCVFLPESRTFAMAGIWAVNKSQQKSFALLTQPSNSFLSGIQQARMPIIFEERQVRYWLKGQVSYSHLTGLLRNLYASEKMNAYPLNAKIIDSGINSADVLNPAGPPLNHQSEYLLKDKLIPLGWGRSKEEKETDPLWKQMGINPGNHS